MTATSRRTVVVLGCTSFIVLSGVMASVPAGHARAAGGTDRLHDSVHAAEVARIRIRFDSVLLELRQAPASHLSPEQRAARSAHIAELTAYRDRGMFPHNHDFDESWTPYFVDHRGVLCAMAHLLARSGRRDIVDRVAAANNNVLVADLARDRAFREWLEAAGLTLEEAARIQPKYDHTPPESERADDEVNAGMAVLAGGLGGAAIVWNVRADGAEHRGLRAALGFAGGALGIALAARHVDDDGTALAVGVTTGAIGLTSTFMAARALFGSREEAESTAARPDARGPTSFSIAPSVGRGRSGMAPGVTLSVRF